MAQQIEIKETVARESGLDDCGCGCGCGCASTTPKYIPLPLILHRSEKVASA